MTQQLDSVECPTCFTTFQGVPIESGFAAIEARPCADANCGALLCPNCAKFACDGCGETFCASHQITVQDGTDQPLRLCRACAEETTTQYCPSCDSPRVHIDYIDLGIDPETGYHDEAAIFVCRACGVRGEAEELVERPALAPLPARIAPARETRIAAAAKRGA